MFLNVFSAEEKKAFLSLAISASNVDGNFSEEEKAIIESYCKEMEYHCFFGSEATMSIDDISSVFSKSTDSNKRIAVLELLGVVFADKYYDEREKNFVYDFANRIGIENDVVIKTEQALNKYMSVVRELDGIVNEELLN